MISSSSIRCFFLWIGLITLLSNASLINGKIDLNQTLDVSLPEKQHPTDEEPAFTFLKCEEYGKSTNMKYPEDIKQFHDEIRPRLSEFYPQATRLIFSYSMEEVTRTDKDDVDSVDTGRKSAAIPSYWKPYPTASPGCNMPCVYLNSTVYKRERNRIRKLQLDFGRSNHLGDCFLHSDAESTRSYYFPYETESGVLVFRRYMRDWQADSGNNCNDPLREKKFLLEMRSTVYVPKVDEKEAVVKEIAGGLAW